MENDSNSIIFIKMKSLVKEIDHEIDLLRMNLIFLKVIVRKKNI